MATVKLELQGKDDEELSIFANAHMTAMAGNVNFPTPSPTALVFDQALEDYDGKMGEITAMEVALASLRATKDEKRAALEDNLRARGTYVQTTSGGDEAMILSAAFEVQNPRTTTTEIAKPAGLAATMGDNPGEVDVSCDAVPKAKSYIYEVREHSDTAPPGTWAQAKIATRSSATVDGLTSGTRYAFRIRALGPNGLESPWSDEVMCMAP